MNPRWIYRSILVALALGAACSPSLAPMATEPPPLTTTAASVVPVTAGTTVAPVSHLSKPPDADVAPGTVVYDVDTSGSGPSKRAPYGDSYAIDRFERPFLKDMTYVPDMDILSFNLAQDTDWNYVSIQLVGSNPNDPLGISYGVEIDQNGDGIGDYILWAHPPYAAEWDTQNVQVFKDSNHDSGGAGGTVSTGDGYETLIFNGGSSQDSDPDLAWVRMQAGTHATVQFAFKRSWLGDSFAFDVVADGGLKDVSKYAYDNRFTQLQAGSPIRSSKYYPLGSLYAVDNTCWEPYHIAPTGNELMYCAAPVPTRKSPKACTPHCGGGPYDPSTCQCQ
jgi:hypothetical protein